MTPATLRPIVRRALPLGVNAGLDLPALAAVQVSSEQSLFPVDNVFDQQRGPGGSCWIADQSGEQLLVLAFRAPTIISRVVVESEHHGGLTRQTIDLAVSHEGKALLELGTRAFTFRPYGPSFQTETWELPKDPVTELRFRITPGAGGRACLTSIVIHP